jgi:hypothetical protein
MYMRRAVQAAGWHVPHVARRMSLYKPLRVQTPNRLIFSMVTCYARVYFSRIRALHGTELGVTICDTLLSVIILAIDAIKRAYDLALFRQYD